LSFNVGFNFDYNDRRGLAAALQIAAAGKPDPLFNPTSNLSSFCAGAFRRWRTLRQRVLSLRTLPARSGQLRLPQLVSVAKVQHVPLRLPHRVKGVSVTIAVSERTERDGCGSSSYWQLSRTRKVRGFASHLAASQRFPEIWIIRSSPGVG
jgi:hypothetical protein